MPRARAQGQGKILRPSISLRLGARAAARLRSALLALSACLGLAVVQRALHHLPRPKRQQSPRRNFDFLSGLRIAPDARLLVPHLEVAEARDLDLVPPLQGLLDRVEHQLNDLGRIFLGKPDLLVNALDY